MQVDNLTPYRALALPGLDRDGREIVTLIVKGSFAVGRGGKPSAIAPEEQVEIAMADAYAGEPGLSPTTTESDLALCKTSSDLILLGFAYAPRGGESRKFQVGFSVGRHVQLGELTCEDKTSRRPLYEMERYDAESSWSTPRTGPFGFGYFPKNRAPRVGFVGTYDEAWAESRSPLLPADFDYRFFQCAFPGLILATPLRGDETVSAIGVTPEGELRTMLPGVSVTARAFVGKSDISERPKLDTVILDAEKRLLLLTWRWMMPVSGPFSRVRGFIIDKVPLS